MGSRSEPRGRHGERSLRIGASHQGRHRGLGLRRSDDDEGREDRGAGVRVDRSDDGCESVEESQLRTGSPSGRSPSHRAGCGGAAGRVPGARTHRPRGRCSDGLRGNRCRAGSDASRRASRGRRACRRSGGSARGGGPGPARQAGAPESGQGEWPLEGGARPALRGARSSAQRTTGRSATGRRSSSGR